MANHYTAHKDEWKALSDIDYFGMFVKAYIPFNAWMNVSYSTLDSDRAKINEIKRSHNPFRDKICALLEADSQEGVNFKGLIGELHDLLESHYIHNQDKRITFTDITLGRNPTNISEDTYRGIGFRVQYGNGSANSTSVHTLIKRRNGNSICSITQSDYNLDELKAHPNFVCVTDSNYRSKILNCYRLVIPFLKKDLTSGFNHANEREYYICGRYKFIREKESIAIGLIEIIYNLRNSLFHGELIPDKDANKVYGAAYQIMRILIDSI